MTTDPLIYLAIFLAALSVALWYLLRRRNSQRALEARVAELTMLSEAGRALVNAELDLNQLAELIYHQASQIVEAPFFQVGLFEGDYYRTLIWVRDGERQADASFELGPEAEGIIGWLRSSRQPLLVRDFETELDSLPARPGYISTDPPRSAVFLPLVAGEEAIGAMVIQSREPADFSADHLRLLTIVANQAAAALANARLLRQIRTRARELELIGEVSRQVSAIQPLPDLFHQVVHLIATTFGYYAVGLFELSGEQLILRASATRTAPGRPPSTLHTPRSTLDSSPPAVSLAVGEGIVGRAAASRSPVVVQDVAGHRDYIGHPDLPHTRSELAIPLKIEQEVLGVLDIQSASPNSFPPESVQVMESLAGQLAIAILEARNYQAERRRADHLAAIARGASAVASILDLDDLLDEVIDLMQDHLGYERVSVYLLEGESLAIRAGVGGEAPRWLVERLTIPVDQPSPLTQVARTGQPVLETHGKASAEFTARPVQNSTISTTAPASVAGVPHSAFDASPSPSPVTRHPPAPARGSPDTLSEMIVPLLMGGRVLGVIDVQSPEPGKFGQDDLQVLQTLADSLAVAVRNARLFAGERRRRVLAEILREVSTALTTTLELDDVLQRILEGLNRLVSFDAASILMAEEPGRYVIRAATGPASLTEAVGQEVELKEPDETASPGQTDVIQFDTLDPEGRYHRLLGMGGPHICLAVPLSPGPTSLDGNPGDGAVGGARVGAGGTTGYLVVDRFGLEEIHVEDVELLSAFASQANVAIENARLYTAQREEAWVSTALLQVAEASARARNLEEILSIAARLTAMLVGVDRTGLLLARNGEFELTAYYSEGGTELDLLRPPTEQPDHSDNSDRRRAISPSDWSPLAELLARKTAVVIEPESPLPEALADAAGRVLILLPLLAQGQVAGAMLVGQSPDETTFNEHRIRLMGGIADQAAIAIERAMLRESWQEEAWVSMALLQVAEALAVERGLGQGLESVARLIPLLAGVRWAAIYSFDPADGLLIPQTQFGLEDLPALQFSQTHLPPSAIGFTPDGLTLPTSDSSPFPTAENAEGAESPTTFFGADSFLALPLRSQDRFLGALVVGGPGPTGRRMDLLSGFAHQLALAIERTRLAGELVQQQRLEREVEVARGIQASFLPEGCPLVPGWEVCSYWQVARRVGGDFYDFIPLPPDPSPITREVPAQSAGGHPSPSTLHSPPSTIQRWGVVIADVADKGVPAALFMALSRTMIRAAAASGGQPGETLREVNNLILADTHSDLFVTVFYLVWEPEAGRIVYAVGGHNPPVLMRSGRRPELLPERGLALGVQEDAEYLDYEMTLDPGDVLLLYTDGITEALNAAEEEFDLKRLLRVLEEHKGASAAEHVEAIAAAVETHAQGLEPFDDKTMVIIRRLPS